jgi:hypothetical protein
MVRVTLAVQGLALILPHHVRLVIVNVSGEKFNEETILQPSLQLLKRSFRS